MTRTVTRRPPKFATRPEKDEKDALIGMCGYCTGPVGAILPHEKCMGRNPLTRIICTCRVCFGPKDPYVLARTPRKRH